MKLVCCICMEEVEMPDYEPEYCCSGHMCGCYGLPIEPPICDSCWNKKIVLTPSRKKPGQEFEEMLEFLEGGKSYDGNR